MYMCICTRLHFNANYANNKWPTVVVIHHENLTHNITQKYTLLPQVHAWLTCTHTMYSVPVRVYMHGSRLVGGAVCRRCGHAQAVRGSGQTCRPRSLWRQRCGSGRRPPPQPSCSSTPAPATAGPSHRSKVTHLLPHMHVKSTSIKNVGLTHSGSP